MQLKEVTGTMNNNLRAFQCTKGLLAHLMTASTAVNLSKVFNDTVTDSRGEDR